MKARLQPEDYAALGKFRYLMRSFLRFSKDCLAAEEKLTPEQYQALLAIKVASGTEGCGVGELSDELQVKHHTAVGLLDKLVHRKLVSRENAPGDRRRVNIRLTERGSSVLERAAAIHRRELQLRSSEMIGALQRLRR